MQERQRLRKCLSCTHRLKCLTLLFCKRMGPRPLSLSLPASFRTLVSMANANEHNLTRITSDLGEDSLYLCIIPTPVLSRSDRQECRPMFGTRRCVAQPRLTAWIITGPVSFCAKNERKRAFNRIFGAFVADLFGPVCHGISTRLDLSNVSGRVAFGTKGVRVFPKEKRD